MMVLVPMDTDSTGFEGYVNTLPAIRQQRIYETLERLRELIDEDEQAGEYAVALLVAERTGICLAQMGNQFKGH